MLKIGFIALIIVPLVAFNLVSCTLAPQYKRPLFPVPNTWPTQAVDEYTHNKNNVARLTAADIGWRDFFIDPYLQKLIKIALQHNRDLRIAVLNIAKTRAEYQIAATNLFPSINAIGTEMVQRIASSKKEPVNITRQYAANIGFSAYELDFFGSIRNLNSQALARYYATVEARRTAHIALVAEVANAYLNLLKNQALLQLATDVLLNEEAAYQLTEKKVAAGAISLLDLNSIRITVETARTDIARYQGQIETDKNALSVLLGVPLPANNVQSATLDQIAILADLPAGLPSYLLQRRPDIMAAEYQLKAANANIGHARAAFFPSISLTATGGVSSSTLSQLFRSGAAVWSFIPQITLPLFNAGRNNANLHVAHTTKHIAIAQYEKTIQIAFKEVADALAQRKTIIEQLAAQRNLLIAAKKTHHLSRLRYLQGVDSYFTPLSAQRIYYNAEQEVINSTLLFKKNQTTKYPFSRLEFSL